MNYKITGLTRVCCVHCTYLVPLNYLSFVTYCDDSDRYEYIIFSETLRKNNIPQYIENSEKYGYLSFSESEKDFNFEYDNGKTIYLY